MAGEIKTLQFAEGTATAAPSSTAELTVGTPVSSTSAVNLAYLTSIGGGLKNKINGTAAPTATDDAPDGGYSVGSLWCDTTNDKAYICLDSTNDAAVWKEISSPRNNLSASAAPTVTDDSTEYPAYGVGSFWVDTTNDKAYICLDSTADAAVWHNISMPRHNFSASAAPTISDDSADYPAYGVGSLWCDTTNDNAYICLDASAGAAVWKGISGPRNNLNASTAPTATDDSTEYPAYGAGSLWVDTTNDKSYVCLDATADAAKWIQIGSGSGSLDALKILQADDDGVSSFDDTGNNATYGNGGTITANSLTRDNTAANLLHGSTYVYAYVPAADGQDDFFGVVIDVPLAWRGRHLGFKCLYKTDSTFTDGDIIFQAEALDGASAGLLTDTTLEFEQYYNTDGTGADFTANFFVPYDCTQLSVGYQNTTTTSTIEFYFDRFELTADPFVIADFSNLKNWESATVTGDLSGNTTYYCYRRQNGENMEYNVKIAFTAAPTSGTDIVVLLPTGDVIDSTKLTNVTDGEITVGHAVIDDSSTTRYPAVVAYHSSTEVAVRNYGVTGANVQTGQATKTAPITLGNGDEVNMIFSVPLTRLSAYTEHIVTPTRMSQPVQYQTNAGQSIPNNTTTVIDFEDKVYDNDSLVTTGASWKYTCVRDEYLLIIAAIEYNSSATWAAGEISQLMVRKNGSIAAYIHRREMQSATDMITQHSGSMILKCAKGDYVDIAAFQLSGGALTLVSTATQNYVCIQPLSTTPVLGAIPTKVFPSSVSGNDGTAIGSGASTFVGFDTTDFDAGSYFSNVGSNNSGTYTSTTYWTCPVDGYFTVNVQITTTDTVLGSLEDFYLRVYKNGSVVAGSQHHKQVNPVVGEWFTANLIRTLKLVAGDILSVNCYHEAGSNLILNTTADRSWFQVTQL